MSSKKNGKTRRKTGKRKSGRFRRYFDVLTARKTPLTTRLRYAAGGLLSLAGLILTLVLVYGLILIPFTPTLSELRSLRTEKASIVLDADGEEITRYQRIDRTWVDLYEISPHVVEALIATEDHRFYNHRGVDTRRLITSSLRTLVGSPQGASTLTMQLARNLFPEEIGQADPITRKLKEIITALKIERVYTKEEILVSYLNSVPFLYNATGIERAARTYFNKSASDLDLLESATLVGMLKGTALYNPARNPERALARRNVVLAQMVKRGVLDEDRYHELRDEPIALDFNPRAYRRSRAPHFTAYVREVLKDWLDRNGYNLYSDGLVIHTTLDLDLQKIAEEAVERQLNLLQDVADVEWSSASVRFISSDARAYSKQKDKVEPFAHFWASRKDLVDSFIQETEAYRQERASGKSHEAAIETLRNDAEFMNALRAEKTRLETGFVGINPKNGHVKVWVGSRDYALGPYDHVVTARRQAGSTFKPFVYASALDKGFHPDDTFPDRAVSISLGNGKVWRPSNSEGVTGEDLTLRDGIALSKNTITAQLMEAVGPSSVADHARRMGIRTSKLEEVPSLALGTSSVTLLEMVSAYSTIANGGTYHKPIVVTRIDDANGNVLATFEETSEEALSRRTALTLTDMMRGVIDYGTGQRIRTTFGIDADVAGKTGTTQDNVDGWFILMHPELVGGAWVGFNDQRITFRTDYWGQGAHNALYVVGDVYRQAFRNNLIDRRSTFPRPYYYDDYLDDHEHNVEDWVNRTLRRLEGFFGRDRSDERRGENQSEDERRELEWSDDVDEEEWEREARRERRRAERERSREELREMQERAEEEAEERQEEEREREREHAARNADNDRQRERFGW